MGSVSDGQMKIAAGTCGYVLHDVPHLSDFLFNLPTLPNPLQENPAYSGVKQYFVDDEDTVVLRAVQHKDGERGIHFRRAGPRQKVYFAPDDVKACIVTCGGLCPGLNTVIREIVCGLDYMYGVTKIMGISGGYGGFYSRNTIPLTPKFVNNIHKRGGSVIGASRGGRVTSKIVDTIQDRGINQVYIIGGDGTQKGAAVIFEEIRRRGLKVAVAAIPKAIDNDIPVIDRSFGFDTAVEEAQRAISAAHVEAESAENGIGLVKLMGRDSGFIAMYATLASRDVDCCLIPESPFYLEGPGGLFEFIEKTLKENGHMVIVVAEGAGTGFLDPSGNNLHKDVGLLLSQIIKGYFDHPKKINITLKYIDPTYMIRAVPSNAADNVYCTLLAQSAVHGAMAGFTGFTVGQVNGRQCYIPFKHIIKKTNQVVITDRMWARLLSSTNQPSFLFSSASTVLVSTPTTQSIQRSRKKFEGFKRSRALFVRFITKESPEEEKTIFVQRIDDCTFSLKDENLRFQCDGVFYKNSNQSDVFEFVALPLLHDAINGISGTIITFLQTGAGTTYTMQGPRVLHRDEEKGLLTRAVEWLIASRNAYSIKLSMVEIYMEKMRDLLDPSKDVLKELKIKGSEQIGLMNGLTEVDLVDVESSLRSVQHGLSRRESEDASRSYMYMFKVQQNGTSATFSLVESGGPQMLLNMDEGNVHSLVCCSSSVFDAEETVSALCASQVHVPPRRSFRVIEPSGSMTQRVNLRRHFRVNQKKTNFLKWCQMSEE